MTLIRGIGLSLIAGGLTFAGFLAAQELAHASQNPVVVERFLLGYYDQRGRFVPVAGRGTRNIDRNAIVMFVFSGAVDSGPNVRASLPLTLEEQAALEEARANDPNYDPAEDGFEPGATPRRLSTDRSAFYVATGSVSPSSVRIANPTGTAETLAKGQFFKVLRPRGAARVVPNRILFNPRYAASTFQKPGEVDYNPEGFEAATLYRVTLNGGQNLVDPFNVVRNLAGKPLAAPFNTTFTTGNRYVQDFTRPNLRTTSPTEGTINVAFDEDIDLEFTEPMDISSFQPPRFQNDEQWTIIVRYTDNPKNGIFRGRNVLGTVRIKPQTAGNVVQFRPLQGFGKGPYEIETIVTAGVTDLSGNNIIRQFQFTFETESNPNAEEFSSFDELFTNKTQRDGTYLPQQDYLVANWADTIKPGHLTTSVQEASFNVQGPNPSAATTGVNVWANFGIQVQQLYVASSMGDRPRTITGFAWRAANWLGLTYPNTIIQIGHANDIVANSGFPTSTPSPGPQPGNYGETPALVHPAKAYTTPTPIGGYSRGPAWARNFNYDGVNAVILEVQHNGNGSTAAQQERWNNDALYSIAASTVAIATTGATQTDRWYYTTRFFFLTPGAEAQSLFYDLGRGDARLLPQQLVPISQPTGTQVSFLWQGAKGQLENPGVMDPLSFSAWTPDIRQLANHRFLRFRATLTNNLTDRTSPAIDTITVPFTFK